MKFHKPQMLNTSAFGLHSFQTMIDGKWSRGKSLHRFYSRSPRSVKWAHMILYIYAVKHVIR